MAGVKKTKKKVKLNLGCGITVVGDGFINVDKFYTLKQLKEAKGTFRDAKVARGAKYVQADMLDLPFKDNYADYIETIDVIEHISFRFILKAFMEMYRVLKPGGKLCAVTANFDALARMWTDGIEGMVLDNQPNFDKFYNLMEVIYGNQAYGGEFHTTPFNPQFSTLLLKQAGFDLTKVKIIIYPIGSDAIGKKIKTQKWGKGCGVRTETILIEAIK
jgi:predicted SAM-dependent methyltransferase